MDERTREVLTQLRRIAADELGLSFVEPEARLREDLGLDSLEMVTLAVALEDHFSVKLSERDSEEAGTVGALAELVARRTQEQAA